MYLNDYARYYLKYQLRKMSDGEFEVELTEEDKKKKLTVEQILGEDEKT